MPPPIADHIIAMLEEPVTVAVVEKVFVAVTVAVDCPRVTTIVVMVTVAVADFVGSATEVALTVIG
jgi:hypothetical protein